MKSDFIYFFCVRPGTFPFTMLLHTVANDINQIVFTVFQNSIPYLWLTVT